MAERKKYGSIEIRKHENGSVTIKDGRYYCTACGSELEVDQDCPECKAQVDWDRALVELRRLAP
jgi:rubrerythrin